MSVKQQLISGFGWNTLTVVLQIIIQLVYTGLLARLIPESSFALMGIVLSIMGFAEIFSQIGIGPALIQRKQTEQGHINAAFYSSLVLGITFSLTFVFTAPFLSRFYQLPQLTPIIQVVCISFTISALSVVPRSFMIKQMMFRKFFTASMVSIVGGNLVVGLGLAWLGFGVWAYVWALFAQNLLMALGYWILSPVRITALWKWHHLRELMHYGVGSTLFNALNYLATRLDVLLVPVFNQRFFPTHAINPVTAETMNEPMRRAAMYERSSYIMSQPITIIGKLSDNVLFSGMTRLQDEHQRLQKTMMIASNLLLLLCMPGIMFMVIYASDIIHVYLGEKFADAVPILQVLILAVVFRTLSRLSDSLLRAKAAVYKGTWLKAIYLLMMAAGIALTARYSMSMVALSIVLTTAIHYFMNLTLSVKLIGMSWANIIRSWVPSLIFTMCTAVPALIGKFICLWLDWGALVTLGFGCILTSATVLWLIYKYPEILGSTDINPLQAIPESLRQRKFFQRVFKRMAD